MKKKSKTLRILLKITSLCIIFITFISCSNDCDKELLSVLDAAEEGNVKVVESYINNGGDFSDSCFDYKAGRTGSTRQVLTSSLQSESIELMKFILNKIDTVGENTKSTMIEIALKKEDNEFLKFLIQESDAHITWLSNDTFYSLKSLQALRKNGYDFNWAHPASGNTILMNYVSDKNIQNEELSLEIVKYLVANGAKLDLKNNKGQTAKDQANSEAVKQYLSSFD